MRPKRDPGGGGALVSVRLGVVGEELRVAMPQNPAALHPDRTKRPRPHRPALVATPGASEWILRVSSPATNRWGRTLKANRCVMSRLTKMPGAAAFFSTVRPSDVGAASARRPRSGDRSGQ